MTEQNLTHQSKELDEWTKQRLDAAVRELTGRARFESMVVEAKTAWVLPFTLLIGRIREQGQSGGFEWFICGDAPVTLVHSSLAATPRDAARHFSLQWQLDAEQLGDAGYDLVKKAEALYELVEDASLWQQAKAE